LPSGYNQYVFINLQAKSLKRNEETGSGIMENKVIMERARISSWREWTQRKGVIWMSEKDTKSRTEKEHWLGEAGEHSKTIIPDSKKTREVGGRTSEEAE
jgi:hypothetical protein